MSLILHSRSSGALMHLHQLVRGRSTPFSESYHPRRLTKKSCSGYGSPHTATHTQPNRHTALRRAQSLHLLKSRCADGAASHPVRQRRLTDRCAALRCGTARWHIRTGTERQRRKSQRCRQDGVVLGVGRWRWRWRRDRRLNICTHSKCPHWCKSVRSS